METENVKEIIEMLTVSGGDNVIIEDMPETELQTVSGNDSIESVPTNVYVINMMQEQPETEIQEQVSEPVYTLFDKPLEDYTVSEGLLLILVVVAVLRVIWDAVKWAFSWFGE